SDVVAHSSITLSMMLTTPTVSGRYRGVWRLAYLHDGQPQFFGNGVWAEVVVPNPMGGCRNPRDNAVHPPGSCVQLASCNLQRCDDGRYTNTGTSDPHAAECSSDVAQHPRCDGLGVYESE